MTTLIIKTTPPFRHEWQRVKVSRRHFVKVGRASISTLIIIVGVGVIIILVLRCLGCHGRKRGRLDKATKASLPSSNTANTGVRLIQLSKECIKESIHALKLLHDRIKGHTSCWSRESGGGWSWRSGRSYHIGLPRTKLHLAPFNGSGVNGTHNGELVRNGKRNKKMA